MRSAKLQKPVLVSARLANVDDSKVMTICIRGFRIDQAPRNRKKEK